VKISQLEYILAVEQSGSINLAANKLFVSQSLISSAIIQLEEELGQPLFIRSNKGIVLTSFGREFLPYAKSVLAQIDQMKTLGMEKRSPSRSLTVCNNGFRFTARIAAQLYNRYEADGRIDITLVDCSRQECIDRVSNHMAELAVGRVWSFQQSMQGSASSFPIPNRWIRFRTDRSRCGKNHPQMFILPGSGQNKVAAGFPRRIL